MKKQTSLFFQATKLISIFLFTGCACMLITSCSGSFGYRSGIGWYFCNQWAWEEDDPDCPPEYSEDPPDPPTIDEKVIPIESNKPSVGLVYGYDDLYDIADPENQYTVAQKVYISLEAGKSTSFEFSLMNMNYSSYQLITEPTGIITATTVDKNGTNTTELITDEVNTITLTSNGSTGTVRLKVTGINADGEQTEIVGCDECDKILVVEIYLMIDIDNYEIFNFTNGTINPTTVKEGINKYLKQAVGRFDATPVVSNISDSWDNNGNGILDICLGCPTDRNPDVGKEFINIQASIMLKMGETDADKFSKRSFTAVLPGNEIRDHYYLTQDVPAGSNKLYIHQLDLSDQFFEQGTEIRVGNWITEDSPSYETYTIDSWDSPGKWVQIKETTAREHFVGESFYSKANGFQVWDNNSYVHSTSSYKTWLHEILHQKDYGNFPHVSNGLKDTHDYLNNVMYPYTVATSEEKSLCGRQLIVDKNPGSVWRQWDKFHNH